jgi:hypothetical protein
MRDFRRLPLLLRVTSVMGLLFLLAVLALLTDALITWLSPVPHSSLDSSRVGVIVPNLMLLSLAWSFPVNSYNIRFRRPDRGPLPLDSWQSQVRAIALLSALPLCGIAFALFVPPSSFAFVAVFALFILGAIVAFAAYSRMVW